MKHGTAVGKYLVLIVLAILACAQASWCADQRSEESLGRQYAAEFEKEVQLVTDTQVLERVDRIGQDLAKIANTDEVPALYGSSEIFKFKYKFKVVEDEDVNAMSLPGGIIYINTGLLDLVESDDELAGVIAHEIAHSAHHHLSQLLKRSSAVDKYVALVALAGILGNARARDMNNLMMGAQMLRVGKMSSYTMQAERDADKTAVAYMAKSTYNPEGLVTFMRKLDERHSSNPSVPLGIYQDHPAPSRRAIAITKAMEELGMKTDVRRLRGIAFAKAQEVSEGSAQYEVVICEKVMFQPASVPGGLSSKERAEQMASNINAALDNGLSCRDIACDSSKQCLLAKQHKVVDIQPEDLVESGKSTADLLTQAENAFEYAVLAEWLAHRCDQEAALYE